ncbi:MAG: DNA polymerase III subunit beta [Deltaproteobacteria bacterium]|nr:DNA polymerase III subunit beta [Deltaproteobacteria bacterium]
MRFIIQKESISDVLIRVQGLAGRKTSLAITENILIKTSENGIIISATDLETGFEGFYPALIEDEGEIAINARKLNEIVKSFPISEIHVQDMENRWVEISSEKVEYHLVGADPEDYPNIPRIENVDYFKMNSLSLKQMIEQMVFIAPRGEEKRPHIVGVLFERLEEEGQQVVRMVSTDIKRLAKVDYICDPESACKADKSILIPKKGLVEINKFLEEEGEVNIGVQGNHFVVKKENEIILVNLMEGDFPNFTPLLKQDPSLNIFFDKEFFLMMLKRMSILTSDNYKGVVFHFENNQLLMRTINASLGESKETIEINYGREPLELAFNPRYFIEAINFIGTQKVKMNIRDRESPCFILPDDESTNLHVIMPMSM